MKNGLLLTVMVLGSFVLVLAQGTYEPGVILLKLKQPKIVSIIDNEVINGSPALQAVFQQHQVIRTRKLPHVDAQTDGLYRLEFPENAPLETIRSALAPCPDVRRARFNYYGVLAATPDDSLWSDQWALQKIKMPGAWDITKADNTILAGIMDSGIDYTHVDLADNIWSNPDEAPGDANGDGFPGLANKDDDNDGLIDEDSQERQPGDPGYTNDLVDDDDENGYIDDIRGWDFVSEDNDPQDESGLANYHGTRAAGVVAARTYNTTGIAGIAGGWQNQTGVRLIPLRIVEPNQGYWDEQRAHDALLYLTNLRQKGYTVIANMSFQTDGIDDEPRNDFAVAVNSAKNAGVIMIAAAGNVVNNTKSKYFEPEVDVLPIPARYGGVLAIGASEDGATLQEELRYFDGLYDIEEHKLLVVAPVYDCVSTGIDIYTTFPNNSYTHVFTATSAACPIAVGVVSLMLSINPSLSYSEISNIFKYTAEKIGPCNYGSNGRTLEVGYGRIDARKALSKANGPPLTPQNLQQISRWYEYAKLTWNANTEPDLDRYYNYRWTEDKPVWTNIATTTSTSYTDYDAFIVPAGWQVRYYVKARDISGQYSPKSNTVSCIAITKQLVQRLVDLPKAYALRPNFPNPFNPITTIKYDLPEDSFVELTIYDLMGREIGALVNGNEEAGYKGRIWDSKDSHGNPVSSGMYVYRIKVRSIESDKNFHQTRKMVLLR